MTHYEWSQIKLRRHSFKREFLRILKQVKEILERSEFTFIAFN